MMIKISLKTMSTMIVKMIIEVPLQLINLKEEKKMLMTIKFFQMFNRLPIKNPMNKIKINDCYFTLFV